jgi:heme oxygenase (mycobilin-producing)
VSPFGATVGVRWGHHGLMSVVKINVLTVPADQRAVLEERFAHRAGVVESSDGFEWFELLRPQQVC